LFLLLIRIAWIGLRKKARKTPYMDRRTLRGVQLRPPSNPDKKLKLESP
jgi:hypothetical protein